MATRTAVVEEQGEEVCDVVEVQVGVNDRVDVGGTNSSVHEPLKAARPTVEQDASTAFGLKKMAGGPAIGVEFDGSRTQGGESHR